MSSSPNRAKARFTSVGCAFVALVAVLGAPALGGCHGGPDVASPSGASKSARPVFAPVRPTEILWTERCYDAIDDNDNGLVDEGCAEVSGALQFVIAWDRPSANVDLVVIDPSGQAATPGAPTTLGLVHSGDCPGTERRCLGHDWEGVSLEGAEVTAGRYRVRVRLGATEKAALLAREGVVVRLGVRAGGPARGYVTTLRAPFDEATLDVDVPRSAATPEQVSPEERPGEAAAARGVEPGHE